MYYAKNYFHAKIRIFETFKIFKEKQDLWTDKVN